MQATLIFLMDKMIDGFLAVRVFDRAQEGSLLYWVSLTVLISIGMKVAGRLTD
jgi:hypothetical protein